MIRLSFSQKIIQKSKEICQKVEISVDKHQLDVSPIVKDCIVASSEEAANSQIDLLNFETAEAGINNISTLQNVQALLFVQQEWTKKLLEGSLNLQTLNNGPVDDNRVVEFKRWMSGHLDALVALIRKVENSGPPTGDESVVSLYILNQKLEFTSFPNQIPLLDGTPVLENPGPPIGDNTPSVLNNDGPPVEDD